jgi:sugar lactone lactonase YvrE
VGGAVTEVSIDVDRTVARTVGIDAQGVLVSSTMDDVQIAAMKVAVDARGKVRTTDGNGVGASAVRARPATTTSRHRPTVVRTLSGSPGAVVAAGDAVHGIALSPDGATLYAILSDRLLAIDVSRYT